MKPLSLSTSLVVALGLATPVQAQMAEITLLPGWRTDSGTHMAALQITLDDGWKTYWRAPGDAGIPPTLDWSGSDNIADVQIHWPRPEVDTSNGMTSVVYHDTLILPLEITPETERTDIDAQLSLSIGVCHDICVPMSAQLSAAMSTDQTEPVSQIQWAIDLRPDTQEEAQIENVFCTTQDIRDGVRLLTTFDAPLLDRETVVVELMGQDAWVSEATTMRDGGLISAEVEIVLPSAQPFDLDPSDVRITLIGVNRAVDIQGCNS